MLYPDYEYGTRILVIPEAPTATWIVLGSQASNPQPKKEGKPALIILHACSNCFGVYCIGHGLSTVFFGCREAGPEVTYLPQRVQVPKYMIA